MLMNAILYEIYCQPGQGQLAPKSVCIWGAKDFLVFIGRIFERAFAIVKIIEGWKTPNEERNVLLL